MIESIVWSSKVESIEKITNLKNLKLDESVDKTADSLTLRADEERLLMQNLLMLLSWCNDWLLAGITICYWSYDVDVIIC